MSKIFGGQIAKSLLRAFESNGTESANLLNSKAVPLNKSGLANAEMILEKEQDSSEKEFWVKKSTDANDLKRELLREHFHFTDDDIKAFEAKYGEFVINDEKKCGEKGICTKATADDIKSWLTKNGKVSIDLKPETIKQLGDFRQERVIDNSIKQIADPVLRENVKAELMQLATGEGETRIAAARNLDDLDAATFDDAEAVRNAIRTAASQPEAENNAVLQIASAKVDLKKAISDKQNAFNSMVNSPGNHEKNVQYQNLQKKVLEYENRLQKTIDAAAGIDAKTGKRETSPNRAEAAYVNKELAELYRQLDEPQKALERDVMTRYYQLDDQERNKMEFKLSKPRIGLDGTVFGGGFYTKYKSDVMSAAPENLITKAPQAESPPTGKDFSEEPFKRETNKFEKRFKIVEQRFSGNKAQTKVEHGTVRGYERNYQIEGSLRTEGKTVIEETQTKFEGKRRRNEIRVETTITQTQRGPELNPKGIVRANVAGGAAGLLQEFNNWFPIVVDVMITGKSKNARIQRENTDHAIFLRDNYVVPPEPKDLPRIKLRLEKELGKENAAVVMKKLEEMSYAAYGK